MVAPSAIADQKHGCWHRCSNARAKLRTSIAVPEDIHLPSTSGLKQDAESVGVLF